MAAISSQIRVIRRENGSVEKMRGCQPCCSKFHGIDQVYNIGVKLVQAAYEERAKEVKFKFGVKRQREPSRPNNLCPCVIFHAIFRSKQQRQVPVSLQVLQQSSQSTRNAIQFRQKVLSNNGNSHSNHPRYPISYVYISLGRITCGS